MFRRILVPLDGSKCAEHAIPVAAHLSHASSGSITFMRVVLPTTASETYTPQYSNALKSGAFEAQMQEAERYLINTVAAYADDLENPEDIELEIIAGEASPSSFSTSSWEDADLIVLCSHGETGLKCWVLGSMAQEAVHHNPAPVLVLDEQGLKSTQDIIDICDSLSF